MKISRFVAVELIVVLLVMFILNLVLRAVYFAEAPIEALGVVAVIAVLALPFSLTAASESKREGKKKIYIRVWLSYLVLFIALIAYWLTNISGDDWGMLGLIFGSVIGVIVLGVLGIVMRAFYKIEDSPDFIKKSKFWIIILSVLVIAQQLGFLLGLWE